MILAVAGRVSIREAAMKRLSTPDRIMAAAYWSPAAVLARRPRVFFGPPKKNACSDAGQAGRSQIADPEQRGTDRKTQSRLTGKNLLAERAANREQQPKPFALVREHQAAFWECGISMFQLVRRLVMPAKAKIVKWPLARSKTPDGTLTAAVMANVRHARALVTV